MNIRNRIIAFFMYIVLLINLSAGSYTGIVYTGTQYQPKKYEGILYEGILYEGILYEGILYEGIDLTNYKVSVHTITGNESSSDFFNDNVPDEYKVNWKKVIGKYSVGTTILVVAGILSLFSGSAFASVGYIAAGALKGGIVGGSLGAVSDAIFSGILSFFQGQPSERIFKNALESSADGFMWGAITGVVAGGVKSIKELSKGEAILNSKGRIGFIIDSDGFIYKAGGGKPQGRVFNYKCKNGKYVYFIDKRGRLVDFDGKVIAEKFKFKSNGILKESQSGKIIGYVDSKGVLYTDVDEIDVVIKDDIRELPRNINTDLKGKMHPDTGVPYRTKVVIDEDGVQYKGVFPEFTSTHEYTLPKEIQIAPDKVQFRYCNAKLKEYLETHPDEQSQFTGEQLEQIWNLDTPDGFVWHHAEFPPGRMQLVDYNTHANTRHTGGKAIWGGGRAYR